jgi:DNA-binding phage protein
MSFGPGFNSRRLHLEAPGEPGASSFWAQRAHDPGPPRSAAGSPGVAGARRSVYVTHVMASKTGFDRFLDQKLRDPAFREEFEVARAEIAATDALIRALEGARAGRGISKAELARRISVKPEIVRRLLTDADGNPTVSTVLKVATALGCHLELVPNRGRRAAPLPEAARQARAATGARTSVRAIGTRPRAVERARSRVR